MYYPQFQIQANLYTNGQELVYVKNLLPYIGSYWKTSQGQYFTGKNPEDLPIEELILNLNLSPSEIGDPEALSYIFAYKDVESPGYTGEGNVNVTSIQTYLLAKKGKLENIYKKLPTYYYPQITNEDYKLGTITRYFVKKLNQNSYIEINKETHTKIFQRDSSYDYTLFIPFKIDWVLTGSSKDEVYNTNLSIVSNIERQLGLYGLIYYFKNYSQFYKEDLAS